MNNKELKDKIVDSVMNNIKSSDWFNAVIDEAVKEVCKNTSEKSDKEIAELFLEKTSRKDSDYCDDCCSTSYLTYLAENKGVINAFLYDEQKESFELYSFRVVLNNDGNIVLIGLINLGDSAWKACKDRKFKFVFANNKNCSSYEVLTGHIPSKEEIESIIPENLRAMGDWYWISTSIDASNAWIVDTNGYVTYDSVSTSSSGVVPYIILNKE